MFVITREKIEALREILGDAQQANHCLEDVKKMLEIKQALLWRADVGTCCAGPGLPARLFGEVQLLESTLQALEEGDNTRAALLFEDFASQAKDT